MLDTDTVSFALRGEGGVAARLFAHRPSTLCISAITLAELRFGAERRRSRKLHKAIDTFSATVQVTPFDREAAASFAIVSDLLVRRGTPLDGFDALIAGHALALSLTLVTRNVAHFSRVPGLKLENWFDA